MVSMMTSEDVWQVIALAPSAEAKCVTDSIYHILAANAIDCAQVRMRVLVSAEQLG